MELRDAKSARWVVAVLLAAAIISWRVLRKQMRGLPDVRPHETAGAPPEAMADQGFVVESTIERGLGDTRKIVLRRGESEMTIFLEAPKPPTEEGMHASFGLGRIEAADPARGGAFLGEFAQWLKKKPPTMPLVRAPTAAFAIEYVRLDEGGDGRPERLKLFLHRRTRDAEIYLLLDDGGVRAHFIEKDAIYRGALVELLSAPLRDGPPPKRSPSIDPHVESATPLFAKSTWLAGAIDVTSPAFAGEILVGARVDDDGSTIMRWKDLTRPPEILEHLDGAATTIVGSPHEKIVALALRGKDERSSAMLLDAVSGALRPIAPPVGFDGVRGPLIFSPDGTMLAAMALRKDGPRACVFDVTSQKLLSTSEVEATPSHWQGASLFLTDGHAPGGKAWVWFPATGKPSAFPAPIHFDSPDGKFTLAIGEKEVFLEQANVLEHVAFAPSLGVDLETIARMRGEAPRWIGPHAMLFASDDVYLLSVDDMRLHQVSARADLTDVLAARADGKTLIVRAEDGEVYVLE